MLKRHLASAAAFTFALVAASLPVRAQGLIWKLPQEENIAVRYEGDYSQTDTAAVEVGLEKTVWRRRLDVKSLGREQAEFEGRTVPCRWLEFKVTTGRIAEGAIDAGPTGTRLYKVLVPEHKIVGATRDSEGIRVEMLPVVRGLRKVGIRSPERIDSSVLRVYPVISLLGYYRDLKKVGTEVVDVGGRQIQCEKLVAQDTRTEQFALKIESRTHRTTNTAEICRSDEMPFGLAKWKVKVVHETKDTTEPRSAFEKVSEFEVEMTATQISADARSELPDVP